MMPGRPEWFVFGIGLGLGYVVSSVLANWLIANVTNFIQEWIRFSKYRSLGCSHEVILAHEGRINRRMPPFACRSGCVICEDLGMLPREMMPVPMTVPLAIVDVPPPPGAPKD